jgi:[ribosomal protein S18]-alanine N-acetyltransferase
VLKIRPFVLEDLPGVLAIQANVLSQSGWTSRDYERLHESPGGIILIAELGSQEDRNAVVGFAAGRSVGDEAELLTLAVATPRQRQGIGRGLLQETCIGLKKRGSRRVYLEVRSSNHAAIALYDSAGFTFHSVRRNYYNHPREDAWIMEFALIPADPLIMR